MALLSGVVVVASSGQSLLRAHALLPQSPCTAFGNASTDWLTTPCPVASAFVANSSTFVLHNGVVSRTLVLDPVFATLATVSLASEAAGGAEKLASTVPEATFSVNGIPVLVGGNGSVPLPGGIGVRMTFSTVRAPLAPVAGNFTFTPGSRGSDPNKKWPPAGVRVEFDHVAPCSAFGTVAPQQSSSPASSPSPAAAAVVTATIIYELYDGTSAFGKRVRLAHACPFPLFVFNMSTSLLALRGDRLVETFTDAAIAEGALLPSLDGSGTVWVNRFLPITASHSYDDVIPEFGPGLSFFAAGGDDSSFTSYLVVEVMHDAPLPDASGPRGMTRFGLEASRMWRTLAPQTEQFPIAGNAMCVGGAGSLPPNDPASGGWCYDDVGTQGLQSYIDDAAALGFEMVDVSLNMNATWRSQVGVEFQGAANVSWFKALVDRAKGLGMEMGAYQLLRNARSATAINQCAPGNAAVLPNGGFDDMDLLPPHGTGLACHNGGNAACTGGPGCCSLCSATEWFDSMVASVLSFWDATGMTVTEQDGAESNSPCANESHVHHHGLNDSVWVKWNRVHDTFKAYLDRGGWVQGMPGHWLEGGQAKVPGGYDEMTWSLPRWTWIHRQRERMIADPQFRDLTEPNALRYFCAPFTPYHPSQVLPSAPGVWSPVTGLESTATLEPLEEHTVELEWALSQSFGTGVFVNFRGARLSGGPLSAAVVTKWVAFAKKYRRVLTSDYVTINMGTVCWGTGPTEPNGTCTVSTWDGILHQAPVGRYGDVPERGLAMVWNPLNETLTDVSNIRLPLYYAGLQSPASVLVRQEEGNPVAIPLDVNNTVLLPPVTLPPLSVTYFVVEADSQ
jgi:hypothetical protein